MFGRLIAWIKASPVGSMGTGMVLIVMLLLLIVLWLV